VVGSGAAGDCAEGDEAGTGRSGRLRLSRRPQPVIGLPGYPVSTALALELFVGPIIHAWQGRSGPRRPSLEARLGRPVPSPLGVDEFVRVRVARVGDGCVAVPLPRGPASREGLDAGSTVRVDLFRDAWAIERSLLVSGSHDLILDLLASRVAARDPALSLSAGPVGSLGGLLALRDGLCHLAGTHLLDEATGDYNAPWVRRLLPGRRVRLLTLAWRTQGLMIRPGNPKGITGLADLAGTDLVFINRQRGSGTRVLLDYLLKHQGIEPSSITGYDREEGSHLGVASAVASGAADAGLGIMAAARAQGLEFIPVAEERYDLAYLPELEGDPRLDLIRDILAGDEGFRSGAVGLDGYDLRDTGKTITVGPHGEEPDR